MLRALLDKFAPAIRIDPCFGNEALRQSVNALKRGDVQPAISLLQGTLDPDLRQSMMEAMCDPPVRISALERAANEPSAAYETKLLLAVMTVTHAWEARGTDWTPNNYPEFQRRLEIAGQRLAEASRQKPKDPLPWISLINVAKGRELGVDVLTQTFNEGRKAGPTCYGLHECYRDAISPKWGGPPELGHSFVEATCKAAPAGSHLHGLRASQAVAGVVEYFQIEKGGHPSNYFRRKYIQADLLHTEQMYLLHPRRHASHVERSARNDLALGYWLGGNIPQAKVHLQKLKADKQFGEYPWAYLNPPPKAIRLALRECAV